MKNTNNKYFDNSSMEGHSEPIISKELWEEVKKRMPKKEKETLLKPNKEYLKYTRKVINQERDNTKLLKEQERCEPKMRDDINSMITTIYFHREKSENWEIENMANQFGFATERIPHIGYETEIKIEILKDGTNKVLSINGIDVSDKGISI